jgi:GNAT superfamily N-acetyltransferase
MISQRGGCILGESLVPPERDERRQFFHPFRVRAVSLAPVRTFAVEQMQAGEEPAVIAALARAFYDDPLFGFFVPNLLKQMKSLIAFMNSGVKDARAFGDVWVAHTDGKVAGAAVWLPPGGYPRGARRELMTYVRTLPTFVYCGRRMPRAVSLLGAVDKAHHELKGPHYYLAILGTDPEFQRTGAGSAVLAPVLERCDTQGLPAYLETQKEANVAYYARHRFELVQKIEHTGCPPIWTLLRQPKPG